jgi:hypothetical protein
VRRIVLARQVLACKIEVEQVEKPGGVAAAAEVLQACFTIKPGSMRSRGGVKIRQFGTKSMEGDEPG